MKIFINKWKIFIINYNNIKKYKYNDFYFYFFKKTNNYYFYFFDIK